MVCQLSSFDSKLDSIDFIGKTRTVFLIFLAKMEDKELISPCSPPPYFSFDQKMPESTVVRLSSEACTEDQCQQEPLLSREEEEMHSAAGPGETYVSQMLLSCFTFWCCGCGCGCVFGLVAFIFAGLFTSLLCPLCPKQEVKVI